MKKILLISICLTSLLLLAGTAFATADTNTSNIDSIQISDNPHPENVTLQKSTIEGDANQINASAVNGTTGPNYVEPTTDSNIQNNSKLNITGPKINSSNLHIKGPKITGKGPIITMSQMDKDIYHFANVFMKNPGWDLYDCIDYVRFHSSYNWHQISIIVAKAHNIALHNYHGKEIMVLGWDVTPESVEFRSKNFYCWK